MSTDWRSLEIHEEDQEPTTFGDRLAAMRDEAAAGRASEAFDEGISLAVGLHLAGLDQEGLELLDELSSFIGESDVSAERWPWFLNTRGMALSGLGHDEEARSAYMEMRKRAEQLAPGPVSDDIQSTALQNLGILALETGNAEQAAELLRDALPAKVELGDWEAAVDVLNSLALAVADLGDLDEAERMLSSVEELSQLLRDRRRVGAAVANRGILKTRRGDVVGAEQDFRIALRHARADGDPLRELMAVMSVGTSLADQGRHGEALRWYRRGARGAGETGAAVMEVRLRRSIAVMLLRLNRTQEALPQIERALSVARDVGHVRFAAECQADLGALYVELGDDPRAQAELEAARRRFAELGDRGWEAQVVRNLAEAAVRRDALADAEALWSAATELVADESVTAAEVARRAAEVLIQHDDVAGAERWVKRELSFAERYQDGAPLAWRTAEAGALLNWRRPTEAGLALLQSALDRYEALPDPSHQSPVRLDMAVALSDLGRHDEAKAHLQWCLELAAERSDRALRQHALANLGELLRRQHDDEQALETLAEAVALARTLDDAEALAHSLGNLGLAEFRIGDIEAAAATFDEQLQLARQLRSSRAEASALGGIGNVHFAAGRFVRAASCYRRAAELDKGVWPVGEVENLGALLESLAAAHRYDELQDAGQRLVDAAQALQLEEKAAVALARTGRQLLTAGEMEGAADLYGAAMSVHLTQANRAPDFTEAAVEALARTFGLMTAHVEVDLPEAAREPFYAAVLEALNKAEPGFGKQLRPYLDEVRQEMEEQGLFEQLRDEADRE